MWDEITHPLPNINGCTVKVWEMDHQFNPTLYQGCAYSSMLRLKLIHVSKRGHWENVIWHCQKGSGAIWCLNARTLQFLTVIKFSKYNNSINSENRVDCFKQEYHMMSKIWMCFVVNLFEILHMTTFKFHNSKNNGVIVIIGSLYKSRGRCAWRRFGISMKHACNTLKIMQIWGVHQLYVILWLSLQI